MGIQSANDLNADHRVAELFSQVWVSRKLSRNECDSLAHKLASGGLDMDERAAVNRMMHAVRRGWLKVSD